MTDDIKAQVAETVARLRAMPTYSGDPKGPHWVPNLAADLLEALAARLAEVEAERDRAVEDAIYNAEYVDLVSQYKARAEAAEARLAEVEEALRVVPQDEYTREFARELSASLQGKKP